MEIVVFLLIIVLALISGSSKKGKAKNGASQPPKAPQSAARPQPGTLRNALERKLKEAIQLDGAAAPTPAQQKQAAEAEESLTRAKARARRRLKSGAETETVAQSRVVPMQPTVVSQGESAYDDEGCVGGSMPHDHAEGESHAEHGRHIAAMQARDRDETALARAGVDIAQLRRAVVMAEVLDRPVSLRRRRRAG